jgi:tight adherence protein B
MTGEIIRIFLLLAIFAGVFVVTQVAATSFAQNRSHRSAINKRLQMIGSGQDREEIVGQLIKNRPRDYRDLPQFFGEVVSKFERMVFAANIPFTVPQMAVGMAIGLVGVFLLALLVTAVSGWALSPGVILFVAAFSVALAVAVPLMVLSRLAQSRRKRIEHQFPIALDIFVRALRSGHPVASAIDLITNEMEDPIGSEFGLISDEVAYGADLITALESMSDRWELEDMRMFVVSLSVQSQTGGNLAEILDNISKVIRDRHQMFMKVRALSSEGRMTGWMLTVLPVLTFISVLLVAPSYYLDVADDPIVIYGSITLFVMYCIGVYVIRRMIDLKV